MNTQANLESRALAAFFKYAPDAATPAQPSQAETLDHNGLKYVRLSNVNGTLAIYRVRIVNGEPILKRLKRWPADLEGK